MLTLPNYQISTQIYESANSLVYRGVRKKDNQSVILKVLKEDYPTPEELTRYQQEYEITHHLNLEGVIKTYGIEKYQNTLIIILEDFGGESLKNLLNPLSKLNPPQPPFAKVGSEANLPQPPFAKVGSEANLPQPLFTKEGSVPPFEKGGLGGILLSDFLPLAIQIADTLGQIHAQNVIHKDINPANIVCNQNTNQVKIIDFGISTHLPRENPTLKNPNQLEGTLAYISPEQTGRMNRALDYRTDLYSLGVTFYELLTGQLPFESTDALELVHCHIAKTPTPVAFLNSQVPQIISDIVMKLMAKNVEDRYQSAFGVKADLEKCLENLPGFQNLAGFSFELAQNDFSGKLQIPQKLYGREREIHILLQAFERVSEGVTEMMLIAGYSGVGKTALVQEVHKPMTEKHGYFASGKFDQFQKNVPYSAISQAFNQFCRYLLMESAETLDFWQKRLLNAVGDNGQIIIDVIPDLELVIGPQPAVTQVGPTEAQNRFQLFFLNFVKVLCDKNHPFILFIDDLQWVDSASLALLKTIILDDEIKHLFIIGAYRDNEVDNSHPFIMMIDELQKNKTVINTIALANLQAEDVNHLLQDSLSCETERTQPLTDLIYQKTQGNAFFAHQFLQTLYQNTLLRFDFEQYQWQWDVEKIAAQNITANVVELMANKIDKLLSKTSKALQLAACIGNQFDLSILAIIYEQDQKETLSTLWDAIKEGLIQPLDENYKHLDIDEKATFKFLHDRVQQAAYVLIDDEHKKAVHLKIARLLLTNINPKNTAEKIFEIVSQFNKALALITESEEKLKVAELNLTASEKAKESNAYIPAYEYLQNAIYLINDNAWQNHYDLTLAIHIALSQITFLTADFKQMDKYIEIVLNNSTNILDKLQVYEVRMQYIIALGKQSEALQLGLEVLSLLNENLSTELVKNIDLESIIQLPIMRDSVKLSAMQILNTMVAPAWASNPNIFEQICLTMINLSYQYGNCDLSAVGYATYGGILCGKGEIEKGYRFGKLGVELVDKLNVKQFKARVHILFYSTVMHWRKSVQETIVPFYKAFQLGIDVGDIEYACYALVEPDIYQFLMGAHLEKLENKYAKSLIEVKKLKQDFHYNFLIPCYQATVNLLGKGQGKVAELNGAIFDKETLIPKFVEEQQFSLCCAAYQAQTILAFIFRDHENAYQNALLTEKYKEGSGGMFFLPVHNFYYSLTLLAKISSSFSVPENLLKIVNQNQAQLKHWADYAPTNSQHKYDLVEAEKARVSGQYWQAIHFYEKAIAGARKNEYLHEEALAYELAAEFYLAQCIELFAQTYLKEAHYRYQQWGALAKVKDLEERYPQWLAQKSTQTIPTTLAYTSSITVIAPTPNSANWLDLESVMKASQTLSGEIVLSHLLSKMMHIVIENAGAEQGFLLLPHDDKWIIEAKGAIDQEKIRVLHSLSIGNHLPEAIISYVARTQENVVLTDARREGLYTENPYIKAHQTQSVLCFPIVYQLKLRAILYFENNLTTGAFTPQRINVLKMLSSQIAISLENAQYATQLEDKVKQRTAQLAEANQHILALNDKLKKENLRMSAELDVAKQLQQMVLPKEEEWQQIESLDIAGFMEPADEIGGDYYDVLIENGAVKIGIGDVTGHGLESGVLMLMVQTTVQALLLAGIDNPEKFLNIINRTIYKNVQRMKTDKNLTLSLLDYQNGQLRVTGQHEEVLIVRQNGEIERIDTTELGFMVGVIPNMTQMISQKNIQLQKGDGIILYTDGITEAHNPKMDLYGLERLCEVIQQNWQRTAQEIQRAVIADVKQHIDTQKVYDDITLLILKQK